MAIIYIHRVAVRSPKHGIELEKSFTRWLKGKISQNGSKLLYWPVYWGDDAAKFRWNLESRPPTALLRQGAADIFQWSGTVPSERVVELLNAADNSAGPSPVLGQPAAASAPEGASFTDSIGEDERADFLADLYLAVAPPLDASGADPIAGDPDLAGIASAAQSVADQWDAIITGVGSEDERLAALLQAVDDALKPPQPLLRQGGFRDWLGSLRESLKRAVQLPGDAISTVLAELRPTVNTAVSKFVGDVFVYLTLRDAQPGPSKLTSLVLDALDAAHTHKQVSGEPIVVITHSMGGQLFYDAITYYASKDPRLAGLSVDHWITCGSQVSLFAEMGVFKGQPVSPPPGKLPLPPVVKKWTNFYDKNDFMAFRMEPVFNGVTDKQYNTGYGLALAHTGYLARPSFFKAMASVL